MILSPGSPPQAGEWRWCPVPPKFFPFPIAFGSHNWDTDKSSTYPIGEQGRPDGSWEGGGRNPDCSGALRGDPAWWKNGIPSADNRVFCWTASGGITFTGNARFQFLAQEDFGRILQEDGGRIIVT